MPRLGNLMICCLRYSCSVVLLACFLACVVLSPATSSAAPGTKSDQQLVGELVSHYFSSWSKPDMEAYAGCFHPLASIYLIDHSGKPLYSPLDKFIAGQKQAHLKAKEHMIERPTQSTIEVRGLIAHAAVRWELNIGKKTETGTDYFTFIKTGQGWKIITLVFEQDKN